MYGVFEPPDVDEMRRELKRGDVAGELEANRELRAAAIIQRRMIPTIGCRVGTPKRKKNPATFRQRGRDRTAVAEERHEHDGTAKPASTHEAQLR
jgi:hypothetical protein